MPEKDLYGGASEGSDDITRSGKALNSKNRKISQISEKTVTPMIGQMVEILFCRQMVEISDFVITNVVFRSL